MAKRVWFRPTPGKRVPKDPRVDPGEKFPPEGGWCEDNEYIRRRLTIKSDGLPEGEIFDERPPPLQAAVVETQPAPELEPEPEPTIPEEPPKIDEKLARSSFVPLGTRRTSRRRAAAGE
jgi:hypothetical protein